MHENLLYLKAALEKHPELKFVINQEDWQTDFLRFYQSQTNYNISKDNCKVCHYNWDFFFNECICNTASNKGFASSNISPQ